MRSIYRTDAFAYVRSHSWHFSLLDYRARAHTSNNKFACTISLQYDERLAWCNRSADMRYSCVALLQPYASYMLQYNLLNVAFDLKGFI